MWWMPFAMYQQLHFLYSIKLFDSKDEFWSSSSTNVLWIPVKCDGYGDRPDEEAIFLYLDMFLIV